MVYLLQLISGFLLVLYYNDYFKISFDTVVYIIIDVNSGWIIRLLHVLGGSLFMFSIIIHFSRNIWLRLRFIYSYIEIIIITGWVIFIIALIEGFLGYLLIRGQMPYWGITVIINIVSVLPIVGIILSNWLYCSSKVIVLRLFFLHYLFGILISVLIFIHVFFIHNISSSNPFLNINSLIIPSFPFIFKDCYSSFIIHGTIISLFCYWEPDILGNSDNQIIANPLSTPNNILPEWYFLIWHCILRPFPDKTIGVIMVLFMLAVLI